MDPKKKLTRLGLHETLVYKRFVQFPVIHGLVSEIMKIYEIS